MALELQGIYVGVVVDNEDPAKKGRLKIRVPMVYGNIDDADLPWCEPCFPYGYNDTGIFFIPEIGALTVTMFINGSFYKPIWLGCIHREETNIIPQKAKSNYPERKIIKTKTGYILFDDKEEYIEIKHKNGSEIIFEKNGDIIIHADRDIIIRSRNGDLILLNPKGFADVVPLPDYSGTG